MIYIVAKTYREYANFIFKQDLPFEVTDKQIKFIQVSQPNRIMGMRRNEKYYPVTPLKGKLKEIFAIKNCSLISLEELHELR